MSVASFTVRRKLVEVEWRERTIVLANSLTRSRCLNDFLIEGVSPAEDKEKAEGRMSIDQNATGVLSLSSVEVDYRHRIVFSRF